MAVIPLESFPLGFRFHPTDEELVNHYLKGKIDGRIRSELEVIPEIDVCKCEPWDLPDKALIRSDDPEWFFFSPKDRKYLNGHRSNRATEAGYWKATGKDRTIRTKAPLTPAVIGMKKTLVFHRGRAPKGVRTNWVMHEYRATEPEFEYGEQGGYVLFRLFRKAEEKGAGCNRDEIEQHGLSPAPTKSFPCETQHEADASEEFGTPIMTEPLNQRSPLSGMQESTQSLFAKENQPSGITRWLDDKAERSLKPQDDHGNDHVTIEPEAEAWAVVDPLQDALGQLNDPRYEHMNSNSSHNFTSPMCLYSSDSFFNQGSDKGFYRVDNTTQNGSMDEFSNSILSSQDEYSGGGLNVRQMSTAEIIHCQSCSEVGTEVGIVQGDLGLHDPVWFDMDTSSALYENASLLSYDNNGPDMHLVDSSAESLQGLFNGMESKGHIDAFSNEVCLMEETGISNVKIRTRQPQNPNFDNFSTQGFAVRRIRLQVDAFSSTQIDSSTKKEENENGEANQEIEDMKEHDPLIKLNDLSIHDDNVASLNIEESCRSKTRLRLRTKSADGETKLNKVENPVLGIKTSGSNLATGLFIWLVAMMAILVLLCFGISRLPTSHSL